MAEGDENPAQHLDRPVNKFPQHDHVSLDGIGIALLRTEEGAHGDINSDERQGAKIDEIGEPQEEVNCRREGLLIFARKVEESVPCYKCARNERGAYRERRVPHFPPILASKMRYNTG